MEKEALNKVIECTISSYEIKVKSVTSVIRQAGEKIRNCYKEQNLLADKLKEILAKNQNLRKKDFDLMMERVKSRQSFREKEIIQILEDFCQEEEEIVEKFKQVLSGKISSPLKDFYDLKDKILNRPMDREKKVSLILKKFHEDHEELTAAIRKLLDKGGSVRIKDFKAMVKAFNIQHQDEIIEVDQMLEEFERVKGEISKQWQKVMTTVAS
ncbi:MAG: hypothetical protein KAW19_03285 [Candidatus Aminicenantes bacterium]|nr:hypothetical protein [Candidatus Aminicenantes bacterium]